MNDVLNRIQTLLNEREWTLYRLAKESGITYSSLSSLFKKDNQPTISTLEKICTGLNISLNEFFPIIHLTENTSLIVMMKRN